MSETKPEDKEIIVIVEENNTDNTNSTEDNPIKELETAKAIEELETAKAALKAMTPTPTPTPTPPTQESKKKLDDEIKKLEIQKRKLESDSATRDESRYKKITKQLENKKAAMVRLNEAQTNKAEKEGEKEIAKKNKKVAELKKQETDELIGNIDKAIKKLSEPDAKNRENLSQTINDIARFKKEAEISIGVSIDRIGDTNGEDLKKLLTRRNEGFDDLLRQSARTKNKYGGSFVHRRDIDNKLALSETPIFYNETNIRFPGLNMDGVRLFAYLDNKDNPGDTDSKDTRKDVIDKVSRRITNFGKANSLEIYMDELDVLRIWYYKKVNGESFLKSKVYKNFRIRNKNEKDEKKENEKAMKDANMSFQTCDNVNETVGVDITKDEFLSIMSPNGPSCLFCSKNYDDLTFAEKRLQNVKKVGRAGKETVCEACRRELLEPEKEEKIKELFDLLTAVNDKGLEFKDSGEKKLKWDILEEVIITGQIPKPKYFNINKNDVVRLKDVILSNEEGGTPIYAYPYLHQMIFDKIVAKVFSKLESIIVNRTFCNTPTHKKLFIYILKNLSDKLNKLNRKMDDSKIKYATSKVASSNKNAKGDPLYKINDIGKFEGFDMKEINKIVINNIQKNEKLDNLKRLYDFTFNDYNCFSKIYELIAIINNLDLSNEERESNVYNSIKFDLDDIPISVNWSYKDDIKITFKEQVYQKIPDGLLTNIKTLCGGEKLEGIDVFHFPIFFLENTDIFHYKEDKKKEKKEESNYVTALMVPNKHKIIPNKLKPTPGVYTTTELNDYLTYKNNKLGFHMNEFSFLDINSPNFSSNPDLEFYWFVNVPKNLNDLQIGMDTDIDFFNHEQKVKIADIDENKQIIKKYKEGTKKEKIIVLKVKSNTVSNIDKLLSEDKDIQTKFVFKKNPTSSNIKDGIKGFGTILLATTGAILAVPVGLLVLVNMGKNMIIRKVSGPKKESNKDKVKRMLAKTSNVDVLNEIHIVMKKNKEWTFNEEEKNPIKKYFAPLIGNELKDEDKKTYKLFIEKLKMYLPSMIHEDGEKTFKKKYNIFFHYVENKIALLALENIESDIVVPYIEEDKKIIEICDDECMLNLVEEAKNEKIENPCGASFCYNTTGDKFDTAGKSKQKILNTFYLSSTEDTSYVIKPTKKIIFQSEFIVPAESSKNIIQLSGESKEVPGIITLKTTLPDAKSSFDLFFNNLFDKRKLEKNGVLIFNNICVDFAIAEDLINILKGLKDIVFEKIIMTNIQSTSIYNILYILLLSRIKFKFLKIDGVKDNSKENYDEKIRNKNQLKENRKVHVLNYDEIAKAEKKAQEKIDAQRNEQKNLHEENAKKISGILKEPKKTEEEFNYNRKLGVKTSEHIIFKGLRFGCTFSFNEKDEYLEIVDKIKHNYNKQIIEDYSEKLQKLSEKYIEIKWTENYGEGVHIVNCKELTQESHANTSSIEKTAENGITVNLSFGDLLFLMYYLIRFHVIIIKNAKGNNKVDYRIDFAKIMRKCWQGSSADTLAINIDGVKEAVKEFCLLEHFTTLGEGGKLLFGRSNYNEVEKYDITKGQSFIESWINAKITDNTEYIKWHGENEIKGSDYRYFVSRKKVQEAKTLAENGIYPKGITPSEIEKLQEGNTFVNETTDGNDKVKYDEVIYGGGRKKRITFRKRKILQFGGEKNQLIGDTNTGSSTFTNIVNILASTKDSDLKDVETGESIAKEMDGIIISNALSFGSNGISLPEQFQRDPKIKEALFKMNKLREEAGLERVSPDFQGVGGKQSNKKKALVESKALFRELSGENGIKKFDNALVIVQEQLKRENLSKILSKEKIDTLQQLKSIISDERNDLNEEQKKFKEAFVNISDLFIEKNKNNKKKIDVYLDKVNNLLVELQTVIDNTVSYDSLKDRLKKEKTPEQIEAEESMKRGKEVESSLNNIYRKYNDFYEGSYSQPQSGGGPGSFISGKYSKFKAKGKQKEERNKQIAQDKEKEIGNMGSSQLFRLLVEYLENEENAKKEADANFALMDKSSDPEAIARGYDDFEISETTVEIDNKNPIMSQLRDFSSENGLKEILMCYGDDKESGCWMYPTTKFKSFSDVSKSKKPITIKFTSPTSQKKKDDYVEIMKRQAKNKGVDFKDMYKLNYTNKTGRKINGPSSNAPADKIDILHPKFLKTIRVECLYSDGIDPNETVRLYVFDKYMNDDFEDRKHKDVARIMVQQPKTKKITIDDIKTNLIYVLENNIILPNKAEILHSYKELAISQGNKDISKIMKGLKDIYKYTSVFSMPNSFQLRNMIFSLEKDNWDELYGKAKINAKAISVDKSKLDDIFLFVVNSAGSNNTLRLNSKYGTLFYNFADIKAKELNTNLKNINKVLIENFNKYWSGQSNEQVFSLKYEGQKSNVFMITIKKLNELMNRMNKEMEDRQKKDTTSDEDKKKQEEEEDKERKEAMESMEKESKEQADVKKSLDESEESDMVEQRMVDKTGEDEAKNIERAAQISQMQKEEEKLMNNLKGEGDISKKEEAKATLEANIKKTEDTILAVGKEKLQIKEKQKKNDEELKAEEEKLSEIDLSLNKIEEEIKKENQNISRADSNIKSAEAEIELENSEIFKKVTIDEKKNLQKKITELQAQKKKLKEKEKKLGKEKEVLDKEVESKKKKINKIEGQGSNSEASSEGNNSEGNKEIIVIVESETQDGGKIKKRKRKTMGNKRRNKKGNNNKKTRKANKK